MEMVEEIEMMEKVVMVEGMEMVKMTVEMLEEMEAV